MCLGHLTMKSISIPQFTQRKTKQGKNNRKIKLAKEKIFSVGKKNEKKESKKSMKKIKKVNVTDFWVKTIKVKSTQNFG